MLSFILPAALSALDWTVDITVDENDAVCAVGSCSLREAIAVANDGDTILFALPGAPPWTITLNSGFGQLSIVDDLAIVGPGGGALAISGNNAVRILTIQVGADVTLSGLTLLNGRASTNPDPHGGCLRVLGQATVSDSRFEGCQARTPSDLSVLPGGDGGAVQVATGATFVGDLLVFANNVAGWGALSSSFPGGEKGGRGGALASSGNVTLSRCTFSGSTAGRGGGPTGNGGEGGAIANLSAGVGVLRVDSSTFAGNHSGDGANFMGFHGVDGRGGALWCQGDCTLNNVTVSGNFIGTTGSGTAAGGGGVAVDGGNTRLRNVTVAGNTANGTGGGIARFSGTIRPRNSLFANNTGASSNHDCNSAAGGVVSEGYNLIRVNNGCAGDFGGTDQEGTSAAPLDPLLGALAANGGPTETRALLAGSVAIDGGDPSGCLAWDGSGNIAMTADQRLFPRPTDGDGIDGADCDIGAFETDAVPPVEHLLTVSLPGAPGGGAVTSAPAGIDCPGDCTESYINTESVELFAAPAPDHLFTGWGGDCSGTGACVVAMSADRNVSASFVAQYVLQVALGGTGGGSVTSAPAGIACPGDCAEAYIDGASVELTATAAPGSLFAAWTGDCTGPTCVLLMSADRAVTAFFDLTPAIFDDGFESGDVCLWSTAQGAPPCPP